MTPYQTNTELQLHLYNELSDSWEAVNSSVDGCPAFLPAGTWMLDASDGHFSDSPVDSGDPGECNFLYSGFNAEYMEYK